MIHRLILPCLAALGLLGCSSASTERSGMDLAQEVITRSPAEASPRFIALLRANAPALQMAFVETQVSGGLLLAGRNGPYETWLSPDNASIVLERGMLHSMRGFGAGLMSSELSEPLDLVLNQREGVSDRLHTYLTGDDRTVTRTYRCLISDDGIRNLTIPDGTIQTRLMIEDCRSLDQEFRNFYWVEPRSGRILQARHWSGDELGAISTRVVLQ